MGTHRLRRDGGRLDVRGPGGDRGTELDIHAHVGAATNDEDFVIFVGAHPRRLEGERENVATLAESLAPVE